VQSHDRRPQRVFPVTLVNLVIEFVNDLGSAQGGGIAPSSRCGGIGVGAMSTAPTVERPTAVPSFPSLDA
jgi:hypothetical protein